MFKRVDRRLKRKEEEEALGIDEEMKEAMGLNDTDSDESASSEDEDEDLGSGSEVEDAGLESGTEEEEGEGEVSEDEEEDGDESSDEEDASDDDEPTISIGEALLKPVCASADGDYSTCVLCPHAILKHEVMVRVHLDSKAHKRRIEKAIELAMPLPPDTDLRVLLNAIDARTVAAPKAEPVSDDEEEKEDGPKKGETGLSNRALKRIKKQRQIAAKRKMVKEVKAKKAAKKRDAEAKDEGSEDEVEDDRKANVKTEKGKKKDDAKAVRGESKKRKRETGHAAASTPEKKAKAKKSDGVGAAAKSKPRPAEKSQVTLPAAEPVSTVAKVKGKSKAHVGDADVAPAVAPPAAAPKAAPKPKKRRAPEEENLVDVKKMKVDKHGKASAKESVPDGKAKRRAKA